MVLKQVAPHEWELIRDEFIIGMVLDNFNADPQAWAPIASATLALILRHSYARGGIDREQEKL